MTKSGGVRTVPLERLRRLGFTWNTLLISIEFLGYYILLLLLFNRNGRSFTFYTDMQLILLQSSCKRAQWKLAFKWPSAVNHLLSRGKDYANERNESLLSNCRVQLIFCKDGKYLRTKQVHNGSQAKKEWREPLLSSLSCKLGSGKTRRKENSKEESTPYDGADSLKESVN